MGTNWPLCAALHLFFGTLNKSLKAVGSNNENLVKTKRFNTEISIGCSMIIGINHKSRKQFTKEHNSHTITDNWTASFKINTKKRIKIQVPPDQVIRMLRLELYISHIRTFHTWDVYIRWDFKFPKNNSKFTKKYLADERECDMKNKRSTHQRYGRHVHTTNDNW